MPSRAIACSSPHGLSVPRCPLEGSAGCPGNGDAISATYRPSGVSGSRGRPSVVGTGRGGGQELLVSAHGGNLLVSRLSCGPREGFSPGSSNQEVVTASEHVSLQRM